MRVLMVTCEWPTKEHPEWAPFLVQQVRALREAGIEVQVFSFRGRKNPFNYLKAWFRLRKEYRFQDFDLIHAQYGQSGAIALPSPIPFVVTFHGSDLQGIVGSHGRYIWLGKILQSISRLVAQKAQAIIVVSDRLRSFLPSGLEAKVIPGGVDFDLFQPLTKMDCRKKLGLPLDKKLVLFPAWPDDPVKRYSLAESATQKVSPHFPVELIHLPGVSHAKVPLYLNASDVVLLASYHEGSPTVIKEALACNIPIVSVDVGDVRERIADIEGCEFCEGDASPAAIASALAHVLKRDERIDGRESIRDLQEKKVVLRVVEVYRDALRRL